MKRKGFTLIEVLAVIVILAIIALIATPVVLNIIGKVRKAAFTRSAENMVKASNIFYLDAEIQKIKGNTRFECVDRKCISSKMDKYGSPLQLETEGDMGEGYVLVTNEGDIEFQLEKGNWCATKYMNKDKIFVYDNKCGEIISDYEKPVIDRVNYTKTTKSITIVVNAHADSGISYYEYSIDGGKTYTEKQENNTYTFNNLTNGKEYEIRVRVYNGTYGKDNYDEETGMNESEIIKVSLNQLPTPIITITNETTWEQRKEVNIDYGNTQGTIGSYSIDGGDTWIQGNNLIVEENNTTIIAKTTDGKNTVTISHLVTHIDKIIPNNITLNINEDSTYSKTKNVTITLQDEQSGLQEGSIKYGWSTSNTVEPESYTTKNISETTETTTITASSTGLTGSYYLWVVPVNYKDKAGNSNTTTVKSSGTFNFDNTAPTLTLGTVSSTDKTITIPISTNTDADSKVKTTTCVAVTSTSNYNIEGTISNNTCTISGLDASTKYYYKVTSTDNALNSTEKTGNITTLASISGTPTITASWPSTSQITTSISGVTADGDTVMYRYSIGGTVKQDWTTSNTYTFTGLSQGTAYSITVETKAQNSGALGNTKTANIYTSKSVSSSGGSGYSYCPSSYSTWYGDSIYGNASMIPSCSSYTATECKDTTENVTDYGPYGRKDSQTSCGSTTGTKCSCSTCSSTETVTVWIPCTTNCGAEYEYGGGFYYGTTTYTRPKAIVTTSTKYNVSYYGTAYPKQTTY